MLKKKVKSIFISLAGEMVEISYICALCNESEKKILKIIAQLEKENFIE